MELLKKLLTRLGVLKTEKILAPHEKAELGTGTWGRQEATANPKGSISARIIRKDGTIENIGRLK